MRLPYRQRFTLIINELGAAVAGRSDDLQAALRRAVPALTETDNLLNLLANDSHTLQQLTGDSNSVITALANNCAQVTAVHHRGQQHRDATRPTQDSNLQATFQKLPGLLEQLRPAMAKLGAAADANEPVLANLNAAAEQLEPPVHRPAGVLAARRCRRSGRWARPRSPARSRSQAADPTIATSTSSRSRRPSWRRTSRSCCTTSTTAAAPSSPTRAAPAARASPGLEALLQYVFNQTLAINTFGPFGHLLAVDAFVSPICTPYATPSTIASTTQVTGRAALPLSATRGSDPTSRA